MITDTIGSHRTSPHKTLRQIMLRDVKGKDRNRVESFLVRNGSGLMYLVKTHLNKQICE